MTDSHETLRDIAFVGRLLNEAEEGRAFALAGILATRGSMPRGAGARMALLADGTWLGTIGGGHIEQQMQERCRRVLAGEEPNQLEWMTHAKTGMACGGDALVGVRLWEPAPAEGALRDVLGRLRSGRPFVITEGWADPSAITVELAYLDELPAGDARGTTQTTCWDEDAKTYVEPAGPDPVAYIFGGGHVGRALTPVLASVGFRVVVFDDREGVAASNGFPAAERVVLGEFAKLGEKVQVTSRDYVVVTTHGHAWDIDVLEQVSRARPAYVGCIGSRGKAAFVRKALRERGVDPAWVDGSIHLPIGDPILAVTPPEIAISIAAEMIRCRAELRPASERPHQHEAPLPHEARASSGEAGSPTP